MLSKTAAIVIPIYKTNPNDSELKSLQQCLKVFKNHPIIFVGPESLNTTFYQSVCKSNILFNIQLFEDLYFADLCGYNKLMLSPSFYERFFSYKFILIYQLDAYVFRDELIYWCNKNYDFIGAPGISFNNNVNEMQFLKGYSKAISAFNKYFNFKHQISNVGNGGFSLRRTKKFYWLLKLLKNNAQHWNNNEDAFFRYWGNILFPFFRLPTDDVALQFAIEHNAHDSLKKLNNQLPFGCHAFDKYEPETWHPYIYSTKL